MVNVEEVPAQEEEERGGGGDWEAELGSQRDVRACAVIQFIVAWIV